MQRERWPGASDLNAAEAVHLKLSSIAIAALF